MNLVERLRACDCGIHCKSGCIQEKAADEIERLQERLYVALQTCRSRADDIERLRNENEELRRWRIVKENARDDR